ncbi:ABC transporter ATP-binding protein [Paenibacillus tritici]|uniref:ABC transporter ATP-binding protein n=1 Tax=Paenibacillus tritici TaxID=1873425 RepID=UPI001BA90C8A|nr:ABC transporter ATP-binding protein [Paenibacillus tritici]QUL57521.1 ABC transporter ATP-binding protein [Paenibacillus tritici]
MINLTNLSYAFGSGSSRAPVFSELSMNVRRGEFISVVGASGCGKSTLFKIIAGLLEPASGSLTLNGVESTSAAQRLGRVAYMPQQDLLLPWRTVLDNCLLPWELKRSVPKADAVTQIRTLLDRFGLTETEGAYPHELSGGMRQRVAVLRTVAAGNELLLLDEPFGALDAITKRALQIWLLELWSELDKTVLFITHDLEEALLLSDRIYLMTGSQGGGIQEFTSRLPRPRHHSLNYEPQFAALRQELELKLYDNRLT